MQSIKLIAAGKKTIGEWQRKVSMRRVCGMQNSYTYQTTNGVNNECGVMSSDGIYYPYNGKPYKYVWLLVPGDVCQIPQINIGHGLTADNGDVWVINI